MTEREMTALLAGLLTLEIVEKTRSTKDWRAGARPKFREPAKIGRMTEFKRFIVLLGRLKVKARLGSQIKVEIAIAM